MPNLIGDLPESSEVLAAARTPSASLPALSLHGNEWMSIHTGADLVRPGEWVVPRLVANNLLALSIHMK